MKKITSSIVLVILLLTMIVPSNVFADGTVKLDAISNKYPGDSVTISGTTSFDEITVKVIRPNNTVLYVNVLKGGNFTDVFTLPVDSPVGTYKVVAGKDKNVDIKEFKVSKKGGGTYIPSDETDSKEGNVEIESPEGNENKATIKVKPVMDENKTALSTISEDIFKEALELAKDDGTGVRTVAIDAAETEDAKEYVIEIPANMVSANNKDIMIEIKTPVANVVIPGNMFNSDELAGKDKVAISFSTVDSSSLSDSISSQIGDRPVIDLKVYVGGQIISWKNSSAPIQVSIAYKPTEEELSDPEHIVVWYIDENGEIKPVPNGKYNPDTGEVTFTTTHMSKYAIAFVKKTFNDISNYSWAKRQIEVLASRGIINGTSNETFSPGLNITRADFITLLIRALELNAEFDTNFDDVKPTDYYYSTVGIAKALGIAEGIGDNRFNPKEQISRQDMMVLTARALKVAGKEIASGVKEDLAGFIDASQVSGYAVESVASLVKEGIIQGSNDCINPKGTAIRAEAAVIIYRIFSKYM